MKVEGDQKTMRAIICQEEEIERLLIKEAQLKFELFCVNF